MSLIEYDESFALYPLGFRNLGTTCYFNALLQSMLSCTSFIQELLQTNQHNSEKKRKNLHRFNNNNVTKLITELIKSNYRYQELKLKININNTSENVINEFSELEEKLTDLSPKIWKSMIGSLNNNNILNFMRGQQCAREGYHYLLESMEKFQRIQNLFLHRYKSLIRCDKCNDWVSDVECMYSLFEVEPELQMEQIDKFQKYHINTKDMNEFLMKQSTYVDKDFICPKCKEKGEKFRINALVMIPEILVVMSKKYDLESKKNIYTDFPEKMEFKGSNKTLHYNAVAQIEHSGGKDSGHYWAICKRKNGWFNLNDMNVSPGKFQPTKNTYIVFYHLS